MASSLTPDTRGPLSYLWWLSRSQAARTLAGAFWGTAYMVSLMVPPFILARAVDAGLVDRDMTAVVWWSVALFGTGALTAYLAIMRHRTMTKIRMDASFRTVRVVVAHCVRLGNTVRGKVTSGEVVSVGATDVTQIAQALTITGPGVGAVVAYVVLAVILADVSWILALIVGVGVPALTIAMLGPLRSLQSREAVYRRRQGTLAELAGDAVAGLRVLSGTGGGALVLGRYRDQSRRLLDEGYRVAGVSSWIHALNAGVPAFYLAGVVWVTARMALAETISVGELVAVYGYIAALVIPVAFLIEGGYSVTRGMVAANRVIAILRVRPSLADDGATDPDHEADLHDPDTGLTIPHGRLTVLAVDPDSDAVAALDRLGRLVDSAATWGAVPLKDIPLSTVRRSILVADDDSHLFAGPLAHALATPGADPGRLADAVDAALATDIVDALPDGYDTEIPDRATSLSGGQRQRLRLARALHADPDVLLLADPTSAVDSRSEAEIASRVARFRSGRTTAVVSSSPLWLDRADGVVHIVGDRVAAVGEHRRLLAEDPDYRRLVTRDDEDDE